MERRTFLKLAALVPGLALAGCGGSKTLLSPKDPTMLSIWHVYGEQADSPMNRLLTEFNDTVGREKGILLNVTNMTNSAAIGGQLQDAKAGKPGALDLPDLFSATLRTPADADRAVPAGGRVPQRVGARCLPDLYGGHPHPDQDRTPHL